MKIRDFLRRELKKLSTKLIDKKMLKRIFGINTCISEHGNGI